MALALVLAPLLFAVLALVLADDRLRPWLVPAGALVHLGLCGYVLHDGGNFSAANGWLDRERVMLETLTSIRRAGAQLILTYWAAEAAALLRA